MKPNEPILRRIYEWPDGAWVELDLDPRVSILGAPQPHPVVISVRWRQGPPYHDMVIFELKAFSDTSRRAVVQLDYNDHLSGSQKKKLLGFLLDLQINDHPNDTNDLLYGARRRRMATYPRWVTEERWDDRYSSFCSTNRSYSERWLGHIRDLNLNVKESGTVKITWSTETTGVSGINDGIFEVKYPRYPGSFVSGVFIASDLESAIRMACDTLCEKELLLPISAKDEWESANTEKGRFLIPSEEEVQVFRILDEPLPFFWKTGLEEFLLER
jgi:hypothetical protein